MRALTIVCVVACVGCASPPTTTDASADGGAGHDAGPLDAGLDGSALDAGHAADAGPLPAPSPVNVGWIGGACEDAEACFDVTDAVCLRDGYPNGMCTQRCDGLCPDRGGPDDTITVCVDGLPHGFGEGVCLARCDLERLPPTGCPEGYRCVEHNRYGAPSTVIRACVPDVAPTCPGALDDLVPLPYPDRGAVWIPAEAACTPELDLLVMLHGINPESRPTPSLGGGRRIEVLVRRLIDAGLLTPLVLAEPVHFEPGSSTLYGAEFDPVEHLARVGAILAERGLTARSVSYVGHSGAGCARGNGMYEVLGRYDAIVGPFAPRMRLWGLMDVCYAGAYHWDVPRAVLGDRDVVIANMMTTGGTTAELDAFEAGLLTASRVPLDCNGALYARCVRHPDERWCSYRTRSSAPIDHSSNPYFFLRELLPRVFSPDPSVEPCR